MWLGSTCARRFIANRAMALGLLDDLLDQGSMLKLGSVDRIQITGDQALIVWQGRLFSYHLVNVLDFALFTSMSDELVLSVSGADPATLDMMDIPAEEVDRPSRTAQDRLMRHLWQPEDHFRWHDFMQNENIKIDSHLEWRLIHSQSGIYAAALELGMIDFGEVNCSPIEFRARTAPIRRFGEWNRTPGSKMFALAANDGRILTLANTKGGKVLEFWAHEICIEGFLDALNELSVHSAI